MKPKPDTKKWSAWEVQESFIMCGTAEHLSKLMKIGKMDCTAEDVEKFMHEMEKDGLAAKNGDVWFYGEDPESVKKAAEVGVAGLFCGRSLGERIRDET